MPRSSVLAAVVLAVVATACSVSAPPVSETTPTTRGAALDDLHLDAAGILPVPVGALPDELIEQISVRYGGPDRDSEWGPSASAFGDCPGIAARAVGWGSLVVVFIDDGASRSFFTFGYGFDPQTGAQGDPRQLGLVTRDGIGLGTTRSELEAMLPNRVTFDSDAASDTWAFAIDEGAAEFLRGVLSGPGPDAQVVFIERVPGCV